MTDSDLMFRPATELAAMVRSGEVSSRELVETSLARIEQLNPELNAFVEIDGERALATAEQIKAGDERPFAGVPIAIKNNRPVAGLKATIGCSLLADHVADHDCNITRRFKEAGFVIVGTTTLPEYGILPVSEARLFGPTRNPWDLERTPGGSSGGSAAAVASGMVPVAHGNDGGGSIRIPAACCGLVGLKLARGRISAAPERGEAPLDVDGVLTRTVGDTAAILDVLAGYELGDATWAPPPSEPFAAAAGTGARQAADRGDHVPADRRRGRRSDLRAGGHRCRRAAALARSRGRGGRSSLADRGSLRAVRRPSSRSTSRFRSSTPAWSPAASRPPRTWSR